MVVLRVVMYLPAVRLGKLLTAVCAGTLSAAPTHPSLSRVVLLVLFRALPLFKPLLHATVSCHRLMIPLLHADPV